MENERGAKIRELIAQQLEDFINHNKNSKDLHIVAHSLGTVILWDILFSDRFTSSDPAFKIRDLIQGKTSPVVLRSVTTMGSPISFLNLTLNIQSKQIKNFANQFPHQPLDWLNIIHAADIIAYPVNPLFESGLERYFKIQDYYLEDQANFIEGLSQNLELVGVVAGSVVAYISYWKSLKVAQLISNRFLTSNNITILQSAINRLNQVPGITQDQLQLTKKLNLDQILISRRFKDGSGELKLTKNGLGIHNIYIFDQENNNKYAAYVGWIHVEGLKQAIQSIENLFDLTVIE